VKKKEKKFKAEKVRNFFNNWILGLSHPEVATAAGVETNATSHQKRHQ
jgi:hypothetical protein